MLSLKRFGARRRIERLPLIIIGRRHRLTPRSRTHATPRGLSCCGAGDHAENIPDFAATWQHPVSQCKPRLPRTHPIRLARVPCRSMIGEVSGLSRCAATIMSQHTDDTVYEAVLSAFSDTASRAHCQPNLPISVLVVRKYLTRLANCGARNFVMVAEKWPISGVCGNPLKWPFWLFRGMLRARLVCLALG
jgi:hypothetical protein